MAAHAGETAKKDADFECSECHEKIHLAGGDKVPKCPNCGNDSFKMKAAAGRADKQAPRQPRA